MESKFKIPRDKIRPGPFPPSHRGYEFRSFGAIPFIDLLLFCGFLNESSIHWNVAVARPSGGRGGRAEKITRYLVGESKKWHQSEHSEHSEQRERQRRATANSRKITIPCRGELHIVHSVRLFRGGGHSAPRRLVITGWITQPRFRPDGSQRGGKRARLDYILQFCTDRTEYYQDC